MKRALLTLLRGVHEIRVKAAETLATTYTIILPDSLPPGDRLLGIGEDGRITYLASSNDAHEETFTAADLTAGKLLVPHGLGQKVVFWSVADGTDRAVIPDDVHFVDVNSLELDLSEFGTFAGEWIVRVKR